MQLNKNAFNQRNFNYKYNICLKKLNSIDSNVNICFILTPYHNPTSQSFLPSPLNLQYFKPETNHL